MTKTMAPTCFLGALVALAALVSLISRVDSSVATTTTRSFTIDYDGNTFLKDNVPFRYVSGSVHSYRIPRVLWQDRLDKMWAAGLNAIQIYVFWNEHEPSPGVYDFDGQNDIFAFIRLAEQTGFVVILRPGPYVCAEHEYGGLPWWLLANNTGVYLPRSSEPIYINAVHRWYSVLLPKIAPLLYANGGPIITVQVENEYGSYYTCDKGYLTDLRDTMRKYLGNEVVLFTTDNNRLITLECGYIDDVYATVDFGTQADVAKSFSLQRRFSPKGPLVNSEFYPGWLDFWGSPHSKVATGVILKSFVEQMDAGANVNFYMFHGGTNFGYSNGANPPFMAEPTSYDYDAPISEPGDVTDKYLAIRNTISKYLPLPNMTIPANSTKVAYGNTGMVYYVPLVDAIMKYSSQCENSFLPQTFEQLGQGYGFILYSTTLPTADLNGKVLSVPGIRDRGYVQIGSASVGVLYREGLKSLTISLSKQNTNRTLYIIVENMGRINFGNNLIDNKGIISNVTLDGVVLTDWVACLTSNFVPNFQKKYEPSAADDFVNNYRTDEYLLTAKRRRSTDFSVPALYIGQFVPGDSSQDTFLKMTHFTKGVALVRNDETLTNLGRYWPNTGPQVTLYTPGAFLTPNRVNSVALIEFEGSSCILEANCQVDFIDQPIIDSIHH